MFKVWILHIVILDTVVHRSEPISSCMELQLALAREIKIQDIYLRRQHRTQSEVDPECTLFPLPGSPPR